MVRIYTFVGLCAGTFVGVKALDNLVVWMAERREANEENSKLDREAAHLKQQLLREMQEKQATAGQQKRPSHLDKNYEIPYKHLKQQYDSKILISRNQEDKQHKLPHRQQDQQDGPKVEDILHEDYEDGKLPANLLKLLKEDDHWKQSVQTPHRNRKDEHTRKVTNEAPMEKDEQKVVTNQPGQCGGEIHAECMECGETFEIVEPVPHSPKSVADRSAQTDSPRDLI